MERRVTDLKPEPGAAPPESDLLTRAAAYGLERTQAALRRHSLPAALLFDPYNIRYVTGTSIMPVWTLHAVDRHLLVPADGRPVLWEYASMLSSPDPHVPPAVLGSPHQIPG